MFGLSRKLKKFSKDTDAAIAMEFALVAPLFVLMCLGSAGMIDNFRAKKRAQQAVDAVADLMARAMVMNDNERQNLYDAARLTMGQYGLDEGSERIRLLLAAWEYDEDDHEWTLVWTRGCHSGTPWTAGETRAGGYLPVVNDGGMIVQARVHFSYRNPFYFFSGINAVFVHWSARRPRYTDRIEYVTEPGDSTEEEWNCAYN
ncbi:TadE/TadG family type IV pilus assembly protein [Parvularcula sp. IMCC14364]|uniref:TadE/TadG family type IV pilus assembly protein n=1 Tax=Parvularcula sp. IMCC14364 TaxID=3067902 RepID=UPI002741B157|nr:TadE/TadG family type IV pilus assembly protein [Parvularcula sp. IMCC14364]